MLKSLSIPSSLYTELERAGVMLAYMGGRKTPYTVEEMAVMSLQKTIAHYNLHEETTNTIFIPVSLPLLNGEGKLKCTIGAFIEKKKFRIKTIQKSTKLPSTTLYSIASGERMPTVDTVFRLLPSLDFPALDDLFARES